MAFAVDGGRPGKSIQNQKAGGEHIVMKYG